MTTTINASTSSGLVVTPDNSGNVLLQYNGVSTPTFSAYVGTSQSVSSNTWTKMQCSVEEWDTASCYDNVTNYRFTPTVAGYYQFNGMWGAAAGSPTRVLIALYKNGSVAKYGLDLGASGASFNNGAGDVISAMLYMNGTTDYVELYAYATGGATIQGGTSASGYFQGCLLRGA